MKRRYIVAMSKGRSLNQAAEAMEEFIESMDKRHVDLRLEGGVSITIKDGDYVLAQAVTVEGDA